MPTPEALRLAAQLKDRFGATVPTSQAAAKLIHQHAEIERLRAAAPKGGERRLTTRALVDQLKAALEILGIGAHSRKLQEEAAYGPCFSATRVERARDEYKAVKDAIAAVDQWLAAPPTNQCGETCERAKLCATCARGLEQPEQEPLTDPTDRDVDRLQAQVAELTAEVEIARKDALRYRWLRNESWAGYNQRGGLPQVWTTDGAGNRKTMLAEDAMDEAIDRARGC